MKEMSIASRIDHSYLKPDCNLKKVQELCREATEFGFAAVCIPPLFISQAAELLEGHSTKVASVVGYPYGYSATAAKIEEIKRATDQGADEVDCVINISALKSNDWNYLRNDIDSMTRATHLAGKIIKIILETSFLSKNELEEVLKICVASEVNFVKTSTGLYDGATIEEVKFMQGHLPEGIKIKASGGIRDAKMAQQFLSAGADRLGTSSGLAIVKATQKMTS